MIYTWPCSLIFFDIVKWVIWVVCEIAYVFWYQFMLDFLKKSATKCPGVVECVYCAVLIQNPPRLHLTTSKVLVIVWRLRGNIVRTVLYIANVLPLQWTQKQKQFTQPGWALSLSFCVLLGFMIYLYVHVCFVLPWTVESFPFMFWRWRNKLKWAPSSFLLPPHRCGLGAGSIPFRAIVNNKQCEMRGLFISLVIRYWIGDVQGSQGVFISQNANYNF